MPKLNLVSAIRVRSMGGRVLAIKGDGWQWNAPATAPDPSNPPSLSEVTSTSIRVDWVLPYDGGSPINRTVVQYRVVGGGVATTINSVLGPVTATPLNPSTQYEFRVRCDNAVGAGTFSPWVVQTTLPA